MSPNDQSTLVVDSQSKQLAVPVATHCNQTAAELPKTAPLRRLGPMCFEGRIPAFVERFIESSNGGSPSFAPRAQQRRKATQTNSYVHLQQDDADVVLLYQIEGRSLRVLNQGLKASAHAIAVFAEHVLARHPKVGCIRMYSADTDLALLRMPLIKMPSKREPHDSHSGLPDQQRKLFDLTIYRSRSDMALQPGAALSAWSYRLRSRARQWMGSDS